MKLCEIEHKFWLITIIIIFALLPLFPVESETTLELSEAKGGVGSLIQFKGYKLTPGAAIESVELDGFSCKILGDATVDEEDGSYTGSFIVPLVGEIGEYTVTVKDRVGRTESATFSVSSLSDITVTPTFSSPGGVITVTGTHFTELSDSKVIISLYDEDLSKKLRDFGTASTNLDGTFSTSIHVPAKQSGLYHIVASQEDYNIRAYAPLEVGLMFVLCNPQQASPHTYVTLIGHGFNSRAIWSAKFGDIQVVLHEEADAEGLIEKTFQVPELPVGIYSIRIVEDESGREVVCTFEVLEPRPQFSPTLTWIPLLEDEKPGATPLILSKSRDTSGLEVDASFPGVYSLPIILNGTLYDQLTMPGAGLTVEIGKPALPMLTRFIEVPLGVNLRMNVFYKESKILDDFSIVPAQEPPEDFVNATQPAFTKDSAEYLRNAFYPQKIISVEGEGEVQEIIVRGHRIAALNFFPVQYNPVSKQVKAYSRIEVRIEYDIPAQLEPIDDRLESTSFERLLNATILNYWPPVFQYKTKGTGADYLIITDEDFYGQSVDLAEWKKEKGYQTRIVNTTDINPLGATADNITDFIQDAYDTWNPAPTYILLMGDAEFIPPHYETAHTSPSHGGAELATDLYYTTVDGTDYFPDIFIGRISVDTAAEATTVVNKIINYERNPPNNANFYQTVEVCAQFQDEDPWWWNGVANVPTRDDFEDRRFTLTSEEIRDFLMAEGYTVDRIYTTDGAVTPLNYSLAWDLGLPLPADLLRANGFQWNGNTADITNGITGGSFLVYHRNHGLSRNFWHHIDTWWGNFDGWGDPYYDTFDIAGLNNGALLPVVLSIECQAGWFDGETDQQFDAVLVNNFESFCEEFVRRPGGGAVASIGATRNSRSGYNDHLVKGFIDAVWPGFDTTTASGGLYSLGQIHTYGKVYMSNFYSYSDFTNQLTFELFHLFGDPEMEIWTSQPSELDVEYPQVIGSGGKQSFFIGVFHDASGDPIHHAKVCLKQGDTLYVQYTDPAGYAYYDINPSSGVSITITVTKHDYTPFQDTIGVTASGAVIEVDPDFIPPGGRINIDGTKFSGTETVSIYIGGTTAEATVDADAGVISLENQLVPTLPAGPVNVIAVGGTTGRTAVSLLRILPSEPLADPYLYDQWDSSTWHINTEGSDPRWDNPDIKLYRSSDGHFTSSNNLVVGTTYTMEATIHNDASVVARDTVVTFEWANFGTGQRVWTLIGNDTLDIPATGTADSSVTWTPSVTGHLCVKVTVFCPIDENINNNVGQENTNVQPISSPGTFSFVSTNPTSEPGLVYYETRQLGREGLWPTRVMREIPQILDPGETKKATFFVEAPDQADTGETRRYIVSGYMNGKLLGGFEVEVVVEKEKPIQPNKTAITCEATPPTITLGEPITVRGNISSTVNNAPVTVSYTSPDGSTIIRNTVTDSGGSYNDMITPDYAGEWRVGASWEGDETHYGSSSFVDTFRVEEKQVNIIEQIVNALLMNPMLLVSVAAVVAVVIIIVIRRR